MCYSPKNKEFHTVINASIDKRVKYFKNIVGGHCYFWGCADGKGNLFAGYDTENRECISVWPAKKFAECMVAVKDQAFLKPIEIHYFLDNYINELKEQNIYIMVFPTITDGGALFDAEDFRNMMEEELAKYGDYDDEDEDNSLEKRLGKNKS